RLRSWLKTKCVTSNFPTVSARAVPPCTGTAYRCCQPLFSQGNTRSSWLVQNRFVVEGTSLFAEVVVWNTLPGPASAIQTRRPWPVFTSAVQIDHGRPVRWEKNAGGVFWAGT